MRRTTTTKTVATIEVPLDDFVRCNKGMVKLLLTLYKSKSASMQTMKLYSAAKMSNNYSRLSLRKAERMGYITRKKVAKPQGEKGNLHDSQLSHAKGTCAFEDIKPSLMTATEPRNY